MCNKSPVAPSTATVSPADVPPLHVGLMMVVPAQGGEVVAAPARGQRRTSTSIAAAWALCGFMLAAKRKLGNKRAA